MGKRAALLAFLVAIGCGDEPAKSPLVGVWEAQAQNEPCSVALEFERDHGYRLLYLCDLPDGGSGAALERGQWDELGGALVLMVAPRSETGVLTKAETPVISPVCWPANV